VSAKSPWSWPAAAAAATVTAAAAAEALIYVGTACLLGVAAVATTLLAGAWGTGQGSRSAWRPPPPSPR
jgi:hypothetical protein